MNSVPGLADPHQRKKRQDRGDTGQEKSVSRNIDSLRHVGENGLANGRAGVNHRNGAESRFAYRACIVPFSPNGFLLDGRNCRASRLFDERGFEFTISFVTAPGLLARFACAGQRRLKRI